MLFRSVDDIWYVSWVHTRTGWGMEPRRIDAGVGGAYRWEAPLTDYAMLEQLTYPTVTIDHQSTQDAVAFAQEVFQGRLRVVLGTSWWWSLGMTQDAVMLRGLEQMMMDMYDYPDAFHALMQHLSNGYLALIDSLQAQGVLFPNTGNRYVGSGGFGFTNALGDPEPGKVTTQHMWGFCESQETVQVSPAMFAEFIAPYQQPLLERFGLNCYGCCEPLNNRWHVVKHFPNLRRISVSAWADIPFMADALGGAYVFSWKPNPADIAIAHPQWDRLTKNMQETLARTRNCHVEVVMKDCHTLGVPENARKWVRMVREVIDGM